MPVVVPAGPGVLAAPINLLNAFDAVAALGGTLGGVPEVAAAASDRRDIASAWLADGQVWGRFRSVDEHWEPVVGLSRPELGAAVPGSLAMAEDR